MKKKVFLSMVFILVCLFDSIALALDPMGPPAATLKKGKFSAGAEYSHSEMKLQLEDGQWDCIHGSSGPLAPFKIKNRMNKVYSRIGYGLRDDWEVFLRLGAADAEFANTYGEKFNCGSEFSTGFGTKFTFYKREKLTLGGLFQISWSSSSGRAYVQNDQYNSDDFMSDSVEISLTETQIAVGPSYQLNDKISLYGGPFMHFVDGSIKGKWHDADPDSGDESLDIERRIRLGGYVGTQINVTENLHFNIEYQHTTQADAIGVSLIMWLS